MQTKSSVVGNEEKLMEVRLWQAVIVTTIQEWVSGPLRRKREAEEYLFKDQRDFLLVCQSAGLDAGRLRSKLARLKPPQELCVSKAPKDLGRMLLQQ
jgi:predicted nucleic acid-binding protein